MATFDEIQEIGSKIRELYLNDPNKVEWYDSIFNLVSEDESFPDDTFDLVVDYLQSLKTNEGNKLADLISQIALEDETPDNVLFAIFSEEQENIQGETPLSPPITTSDEEEDNENSNLNDPRTYFDLKIDELQSTLGITYDLSYLLLKYYKWKSNEAIQSWLKSNVDTLKNIHFHPRKPSFPDVNSSLLAVESRNGTCPICEDDTDLLELYCGHKICKECLINEITVQVNSGHLPVCRSQNQKNNTICNSEITPSDIYQLIEDQNVLAKYDQLRINSEIMTCSGVKKCQNCDTLITSANDLGCHAGQCPNCHFVTCLSCSFPESHAPLLLCDRVNDFSIVLKNKMEMLDQAQKLWYIREERLKDYRKKNQREPNQYFDGLISKCKNEFKKIDDKEIAKIKETEANNSKKEKLLEELYEKSRSTKENKNSIELEIQKLHKELDNGRRLKILFQRDHNINHQDRDKYVHRLEKLKQFYFWSVTEVRHKFQYGITKFKNKINRLVSQKLSKPIDETGDSSDDASSQITKSCPKCHVAIYKQGGCNYVRCLKCSYEFCWICNQAWVPPHGDHFYCPNYSLGQGTLTNHVIHGIDYDDPKDKTFYPMPLDPDKMTEFVKYNNLYMEYKKNMEKYENLKTQFLKNSNKTDIRNVLIENLKKDNSDGTAKEMANIMLNDLLFAQSIIAWGQAELFYIIGSEVAFNLFEFRLFELEKKIDSIICSMSSPDISNATSYLTQEINIVKSMIKNILISAETQT